MKITKTRANSNKFVRVEIHPSINKDDSGTIIKNQNMHRSRNLSDFEPHLYSSRQPSILTLLVITLLLVLVELQIVLHNKTKEESIKSGSSTGELRYVNSNAFTTCNFGWKDMKCSTGCCLHTFERKGSQVSICEMCTSGNNKDPKLISTNRNTYTNLMPLFMTDKRNKEPFPLKVRSRPGYEADIDDQKENENEIHHDKLKQQIIANSDNSNDLKNENIALPKMPFPPVKNTTKNNTSNSSRINVSPTSTNVKIGTSNSFINGTLESDVFELNKSVNTTSNVSLFNN